MEKQFNVRLDTLEEQMLDAILTYQEQYLGREVGNKTFISEALTMFAKTLAERDNKIFKEICKNKDLKELQRWVEKDGSLMDNLRKNLRNM